MASQNEIVWKKDLNHPTGIGMTGKNGPCQNPFLRILIRKSIINAGGE